MVKVLGIDPGTKSFDFCGLDDDNVILDRSVSTGDIINDPGLVAEILKGIDAELVAGPSGFGVPLTKIKDAGDRELFLMSLIKKGDRKNTLGMRQSIIRMKKEGLPVVFLPGVVHLPTVPYHRKLNKIDMGTPDKVCCAALGIHDQSSRLNIDYSETSFILLEMGFGYTAAIAVKGGMIVDGIGGSSGNIGFLSMGCMDAELAYLLGGFDKELIFRGGVAELAKAPERLTENHDAFNAYIEGAVKDILSLTASVEPQEILISGRLSKVKGIFEELEKRIDLARLRKVSGLPVRNVKEAAQGAALIASGLAGGKYTRLVDAMKIKEAKGTSLDYILLPEIDALKKDYGI